MNGFFLFLFTYNLIFHFNLCLLSLNPCFRKKQLLRYCFGLTNSGQVASWLLGVTINLMGFKVNVSFKATCFWLIFLLLNDVNVIQILFILAKESVTFTCFYFVLFFVWELLNLSSTKSGLLNVHWFPDLVVINHLIFGLIFFIFNCYKLKNV